MPLANSKEINEKLEQRLEEHSKVDEKESNHEGEPYKESIEGERDKDKTSNK